LKPLAFACPALLLALGLPAHAGVLEWKSGSLDVKATGYFQGDVRAFPGWDVAAGARDDSADVRRLRAGFDATWGRLSGELVVDAADLVNRGLGDDPRPAFSLRQHLKNAYLELGLSKRLYVRAGNFKVPVTREFLTSAAKTDFIERARLADDLGPDRDWGVMVGGKIPVSHGLTYMAGIFAGDGWSDHSRAGTTGAARFVLEPVKDLQVAVNGSLGTVTAFPDSSPFATQAKGLHGESLGDGTFYHRSFVDGERRRLGGDVRYVRGALTLTAEVLHARDERKGQGARFDDLPAMAGLGFSATAEWRLRGPRSKKDTKHGRTPVDLAVRYDSLRFDDQGPGLDFASLGTRADNIRPQALRILEGGLSSEPRPFLRLMANAIVERYNDDLIAPETGRRGNYVTLLARLQLQLP
jgi:phosphate-selective porin